MKMNLYTRVADLPTDQRRELIQFLKVWCEQAFGSREQDGKAVSVRCLDPWDEDDWNNWFYGWYDRTNHRIFINIYRSRHIKQFIKTFLHEYTHSTQQVAAVYDRLNSVFGYEWNPMEIHARANEVYYKHAWNKYLELRKLYAKANTNSRTKSARVLCSSDLQDGYGLS